MNILHNSIYQDDIDYICNRPLPWNLLQGKTILVTGASGMIGSCFIDAIMKKSKQNLGCKIIAVSRNEMQARYRFDAYWEEKYFNFIKFDINNKISDQLLEKADYVLHLASNTHPVAYSSDPIRTITTNIIGTQNVIEYAIRQKARRVVFASSNEIYGENRGDVESFDEKYCGYIDCNTLRAGYPESKRCGEALCQAYRKQYGIDIVIPRFTRTYGPTMLWSDTKAISQFIKLGVEEKNIVLKSDGTQYYSYTHVCDAVVGLLTVMLKGKSGEAYNIADEKSYIMLKDLANMVSKKVGTSVVYELPELSESEGYSKATKSLLNGKKIKDLGWECKYSITDGIYQTIDILKSIALDEQTKEMKIC